MPYVTESRRVVLDDMRLKDVGWECRNAGDLCYCIYKMMVTYLRKHERKFLVMAQAMSAAENAVREFYRREVAPYEDEKIKENGDI